MKFPTFVALLNLQFSFSFSGRRERQRFVLNRDGADLQGFRSGSNNGGVADI